MDDELGTTTNVAKVMIILWITWITQRNNIEKQFNLGAYTTSVITKDYAPKQPPLVAKIIEENTNKEMSDQMYLH